MSRTDERDLLDAISWISAFMVFWGHAWAALFAHEPTLISRLLWMLADTRHEWVVIFFVLSGYLVAGKALVRADSFNLWSYALARITRIYIVLIPALILTAALDGLAYRMDPTSPVHAGLWADQLFGGTPPFANYDLSHIAASVLSLEPFVGSAAMGSNGPLWSLGFEWIFYICFPVLLLAADALGRRTGGRLWLARGLILAVSIALLGWRHMPYAALLWLIWVGGGVAHILARTGRWPAFARWIGLVIGVVGFVLLPRIGYRFADALIGFGLISFLARYPRDERGLWRPLDETLASASYSLYVTHLPVVAFLCLVFIRLGWLHAGGERLGLDSLGMLAGLAATAFAVSAAFSALFEHNTDRLRRRLSGAGRGSLRRNDPEQARETQ